MRGRPGVKRVLLYVIAGLVLAVVILNWTYGRLPGEPAPHGSFVQVGKLRIRYLEHAGSGPAVLLVHGLPGTADDFDDVTPLLAGRRTVAIDRPGFGYSSGGYTPFVRQLATIDGLIHTLKLGRPIVVGHSYGGTIALGLAERYPQDVSGLVLVDAAAAGIHPSAYERFQGHLVKFLELPVIHTIARATFSQLLTTVSVKQGDAQAFDPGPVDPAHRERLLAITSTHGNLEAYAGEQLAAGDSVREDDKGMASIKVPAVVVQGESDKLVKPLYGRRIAKALPQASLVMVPGGHMAPYTHPQAVATAVGRIAAQAATATSRTG
jgi:pimeloyl-ACP methyl ester carboxylesterase